MSYYRPAEFQNAAVWQFLQSGSGWSDFAEISRGAIPSGSKVLGFAFEWVPFNGLGFRATVDGDVLDAAAGEAGVEDITGVPLFFQPAGVVGRGYVQPFRDAFPGTPPGWRYFQPWPAPDPDDWTYTYPGISSLKIKVGGIVPTQTVPFYELFALIPTGTPIPPDPPPPEECPPVPRQPYPYRLNQPGVGPRVRGKKARGRPVTGNTSTGVVVQGQDEPEEEQGGGSSPPGGDS